MKKILSFILVALTASVGLIVANNDYVLANEYLSEKPSDYGITSISVYTTQYNVDELFKMVYDDGFVYMVPADEQYYEDYSFNMDKVIPNTSERYPTQISITNIDNNVFQFYQEKEHDESEPFITDSSTIYVALFAVKQTGTNPVKRTRTVRINDNENYNNVARDFIEHIGGTGVSLSNYFRLQIDVQSLTSVPAISGEHTVVANVDSPSTIDRIKEIAELTAIDAYYGDLTDQIEVISDTYTENATKVGNYEIEFKVTNDSNLSTTFKLMVAVKDLVAPVINGPATSEISYTEKLNLEAFLTEFTVTDNHDETVILNVDSNSYLGNEEIPGTYQIKLSATDISKNKGTFTHTIKVIDDVKPNFVDEHSGKITVNWRDKIDDNFLLLDLTANDKIDGDLTNQITIIDHGGIENKLGSYNVKYQVTDSSGNKSTYTRKYEIITTDSPVFWVSKNLLLISDVNQLSNDQLANELANYENIKMASFTMVKDEYTGKEDIPGEYEVIVAIADTDGTEHQVSRTIRVFAEEDMPEPEPTFIDKVVNFFVTIWELIVKVVMWFVNAIKWLWNLIFGWIN